MSENAHDQFRLEGVLLRPHRVQREDTRLHPEELPRESGQLSQGDRRSCPCSRGIFSITTNDQNNAYMLSLTFFSFCVDQRIN